MGCLLRCCYFLTVFFTFWVYNVPKLIFLHFGLWYYALPTVVGGCISRQYRLVVTRASRFCVQWIFYASTGLTGVSARVVMFLVCLFMNPFVPKCFPPVRASMSTFRC